MEATLMSINFVPHRNRDCCGKHHAQLKVDLHVCLNSGEEANAVRRGHNATGIWSLNSNLTCDGKRGLDQVNMLFKDDRKSLMR